MKLFFLVPDSYSQMGNIRVGLDTIGDVGAKQKLSEVGRVEAAALSSWDTDRISLHNFCK